MISTSSDLSGSMPSLVSLEQLLQIMPRAKPHAEAYLAPLNAAMLEFGINTELRIESFLPNLAHETGDLTTMSENLNYSADGLANTWPHRYGEKAAGGVYVMVKVKGRDRIKPNALALRLASNREAIANNVYANRMGNGDEASGDGWRHRGAGGFQLTGLANQARAAKHFKIPLAQIGDWLRTPTGAMFSAAWFYWQAGCAKVADLGDFDGVSDLINMGRKTEKYGDSIGFADRLAKLEVAQEVIS
jgi:putative chitinase